MVRGRGFPGGRGVPWFALIAVAAVAPLRVRPSDPDPKAVDSVFARYDRTDAPGCALGVMRDGRMIYGRGYGMADLNQGVPIRPSTVFYVASTSKQFTAFAIALLAEEGRISLDDPVRKWLPELAGYADPVTIRHLVHHTSGIRDYLGLWSLSGRSFADEIPQEVAIDLIARQAGLDFEPGSRWSYSNSGYLLLSGSSGGPAARAFASMLPSGCSSRWAWPIRTSTTTIRWWSRAVRKGTSRRARGATGSCAPASRSWATEAC